MNKKNDSKRIIQFNWLKAFIILLLSLMLAGYLAYHWDSIKAGWHDGFIDATR